MKYLSLVVSALLATGTVLAAPSSVVLVDANGSVLVNQGKQFVSAKSGQLLTVGDRIMVMEGANASVRFADGCVLQLNAGSLATISNQSSCVAGQNNAVAQIAPLYAQTVASKASDCDDDGIADSQDGDIDGDGKLNDVDSDDYDNCKKAAGYNNEGIWYGTIAVAAIALFTYEQNRTVSP
jgi:hypothetical protein